MIAGFDIDGVIIDTPTKMIEYINQRLPLQLDISDIITYKIEDALPEQYRWIVENGFKDSLFWKSVKLIDGAYETLKKLYKEGYEIWFVTSSLPQNLRKKINHLQRCLDFLPKDYVWRHTINTQNKQLIRLDVLVDDGLFNLIGERTYWSICFDMPYNQTDDASISKFYRAYNWHDVYGYIKGIEKELTESQFGKSRLDKE